MVWPEMVERVAVGPKLGNPYHPAFAEPGNQRRWFLEGDLGIGIWGFEILIGYASRLDDRMLPKLQAVRALTENRLTLYRDTLTPVDTTWWRVYSDETPLTQDFIRFYATHHNQGVALPDFIPGTEGSKEGLFDAKWGSGKGADSQGQFVFVRTNGLDHKVYV